MVLINNKQGITNMNTKKEIKLKLKMQRQQRERIVLGNFYKSLKNDGHRYSKKLHAVIMNAMEKI